MRKFLLRVRRGSRGGRKLPPVIALAALSLLIVGGADGALVRVGRIVVRADGGFTPRTLPKRTYAPIRFEGRADLNSTDSGPVPRLQRLRLDFDRDGRLSTRGLAVCPPARIEGTTTRTALRRCRGALVGNGNLGASLALPGFPRAVSLRSPLLLFNGPRLGGHPTIVAHARETFPTRKAYVVVIPIERRHGSFAYRATIEIPEFAGGYGSLTHVDGRIGRRYGRGARRSYVSARCSDGVLETRGRLDFTEGTVIEGSVYRACSALPRKGRR